MPQEYVNHFYLDGTRYNIDAANGVVTSTTAPSSPREGQLWYDSTNDVLKVYNGSSWDIVDTNTTYSTATSSVAGLVKLASDTVQSEAAQSVSSTADRTYGVQLNSSDQMVVNVPWTDTHVTVEDSLTSSSTTNALSANQGRELNSRLETVEARGRFLSNWNAATGLPTSNPGTLPYTYRAGDYYYVNTVSSANPPVNYRPSGSTYNGTASSTAETEDLAIGDTYVYDGTNWLLQQNHNITTSFSSISGQPSDNTNLATALNAKQNTLATQTAYTSKGTASKVPQITTNTLGQVTGITEVDITYPSQVSDTAYAASWDGVTATAPSKNAVYDKISAMDTTISGKQDTLTAGSGIDITSNTISNTAIPTVMTEQQYGQVTPVNGKVYFIKE